MVIARFHRTLAIGFFLLVIAAVTVLIGGVMYFVWAVNPWMLFDVSAKGIAVYEGIFGLITIPVLILMIVVVFRDSRGIWIEDGALHFYSSFSSDIFMFLMSEDTVPLDSIAGLSSFKEASGVVEHQGVYVNLKSGKSYKVLTFLLQEPRDVVMARLRAELGFSEAGA
jgi:hypothetical protein